ncbi:MAG: type II secretion system F family protein [Lachnospiraceae bacterium]|nr:type II secretion system F family protein [Lachnospiraceae bacterium]
MRQTVYIVQFLLVFTGLFLLFSRIRWLEILHDMLQRGREGMDEAARRRLLENRRQLVSLQKEHSLWYRLEQELNYSGWKRRLPYLTAEMWLAGNIVLGVLLFLILTFVFGWWKGLFGIGIAYGMEYLILCFCKAKAFRSVNTNLIKFLDFLGNYSITAGELTGIFKQISKYLDEPLRTALDECSNEAQTTGDGSLALLVMAEKIEHPKFKELTRNMEISIRYSADFTALVNSSRKNMREYMRTAEERKSLIREAAINMLLLLAMSVVTLFVVDGLIEASVWTLLWKTWPGRIASGAVLFILFLFAGKIYGVNH